MSVSFVAGSTAELLTGAVTSTTWSVTIGSGADRFLLLHVGVQAGSLTGLTYGGVALTRIGSTPIYYLVNPASGANNLVYSHTTNSNFYVTRIELAGVDPATPLGAEVSGSGTSSAVATSSATLPTGAMLVGGMMTTGTTSAGTTVSAGAGTTLVGSLRASASGKVKAGGYRGTTGTLAWTISDATARAWTAQGVVILPAGSGAVAYEIDADVGSFSLTGRPVDFEMANRLMAAAGVFLASGQAAALRRGSRLAAAPGAFSLGGQAAGLVHTIPGATLTTKPFKRNNGLLLPGLDGLRVVVLDLSTPEPSLIAAFAGLETDLVTARLQTRVPGLTPGVPYGHVTVDEAGTVIGADIIVAES